MTKTDLKKKFQEETGRSFEEASHEVMYTYASWLENYIVKKLPERGKLKTTTMNIKTKFNIHDLVKHKYGTNKSDFVTCMEILAAHTESCHAGTQVFYLCRSIIAHKEIKPPYSKKEDEEETWYVGHGINSDIDFSTGWRKYREDELILISKEEKIFFEKAKKK